MSLLVALGGPVLCVALVLAARRADRGHTLVSCNRCLAGACRAGARRLAAALEAADLAVSAETAIERWALVLGAEPCRARSSRPRWWCPRSWPVWRALPSRSTCVARATSEGSRRPAGSARAGRSRARRRERRRARAGRRLRLAGGARSSPGAHQNPARSVLARRLTHGQSSTTPGARRGGALAVAASLGGHAADAIDGLATSVRHRLDAAEAQALSTQARLSAVVVGAAPLGYLAFASLLDARAVSVGRTGIGRAVCGRAPAGGARHCGSAAS